jgi:hypothetical protein
MDALSAEKLQDMSRWMPWTCSDLAQLSCEDQHNQPYPSYIICITSTLQRVSIKTLHLSTLVEQGQQNRCYEISPQAGFWASSKQIVKSKLPPCSLLPAEVAVPSTRQVYSTNPGYPSTTELHKQLDLEKSFHIYSFDLRYPSTNTSPSWVKCIRKMDKWGEETWRNIRWCTKLSTGTSWAETINQVKK